MSPSSSKRKRPADAARPTSRGKVAKPIRQRETKRTTAHAASPKLVSRERDPAAAALVQVAASLNALLLASGHTAEARRAHDLAMHAAIALAGQGDHVGATDERIEQAHNVFFGGRPSDADGIKIAQCGDALIRAASLDVAETTAVYVARESVRAIDPPLASGDLARCVRKLRAGEKVSGVVTDLLRSTLALSTKPKEDRQSVQNRVNAALRRARQTDTR